MTTLLSTRHLLAQSEQQQQSRVAPPAAVRAAVTGQERAGVVSRSSESRSITTQNSCSVATPVAIGPGDAVGLTQAENPIRFRWLPVANATSYELEYQPKSGSSRKVEVNGTEYEVTLPAGETKWKVLAWGPGKNCKSSTTNELKFKTLACTLPTIVTPPAAVSLVPGASTILTVVAAGPGPLTYKWYRGSTQVGGNSNTLDTGALTQTTTYRVDVINSCGTVRSSNATVTVDCDKPSITQQPSSTTIESGASATLSVTASGTAPLIYQWYRGSTKVGANSSTFDTGALTQTTKYRVEVTNACGGHKSHEVTVTVAPACVPPSITRQPESTTLNGGGDDDDDEDDEDEGAKLSVTASGSSPLTYQWYRGTTRVGSNSRNYSTGRLTETTKFRVEVTNSCGSVTSNEVTVTVPCNAPSITRQPQSTTIEKGDSATLSVNASGSGALSYQWYRGTAPVGTNNRTLATGALTETTKFRVEVRNSCGVVASSEATVTVTEGCAKPSIARQPEGLTIEPGTSATLTVAANGTAPLTYQWYRGTAKVGSNSATFVTGTLTETATFRVEVSNACGQVASNEATVTVTKSCTAPSIATQPADSSITSGTSATLSVVANGTAPLTYQWYRGNAAVGTNSSTLTTAALTQTTKFRVEVRNECGNVTSREATITVTAACLTPTAAPRASAVASSVSGASYTISWTPVANATIYQIEEASDASFANAQSRRVNDFAASYRHEVTSATSWFYRVRAVNGCNDSSGPWSAVTRVAVMPKESSAATSTDLVVPHGSKEQVLSVVTVDVDPTAVTFIAEASEPWITITPVAGAVPSNGRLVLTLSADPSSLPHGTSTASLRVRTHGGSSRGIGTNGSTSLVIPVSISLVTPVYPAEPTYGGEVMILPAVAHADGNNSKWQSDVRIAHTYPRSMRYLLTFTPSGATFDAAQQTQVTIDEAQTIALDDILGRWFGAGMAATGSSGVLEIRALDAAPGTGRTLATSRLYNITDQGSFGQFIAAVPLSKFLATTGNTAHSLVGLAQSDRFRTNLGLVEGSGHASDVLLEVFSAAGAKLFDTTLRLAAGEHRQIGSLLAAQGINTTDARIDVKMLSTGKVFSYASVIDNSTGDPSFVASVDAASARARQYTIAGIANLDAGNGGKWQSDVRLFNGGLASANATLEFYAQGATTPTAVKSLEVAPGQMMVLDDVLRSLFDITGQGGALRISTAIDTALIPSARTYHRRDGASYGQFIPAVTDADAIGLGQEPLRMLQVEESERFRTNVGLVETSGRAATVEVSASLPNTKVAAVTQFELQPNEFRQLNALLRSMGLEDAYNATVTVRVVGGEGRVVGYASVIDNRTQDPTYVMGF